MNRQELNALTSFCAAQRDHFLMDDWTARKPSALDARTLAFMAKYLSMTSWFGHEDELARIAETIYPDICAEEVFDRLQSEVDVDLGDLSMRLRLWHAVH